MIRYYDHNAPFELESGAVLPALRIAFHTYGELNAARDNTVWVCHALTASSDVADWWPHTVGEGRFLDPSRHFVVCANILGSHYGTTGPLHTDPATGRPYYGSFPAFTIRDMVRAHRLLADALGIRKIRALVGSSVGGFQAVEWAVAEPERFGRLALIATAAKASPWAIAIDETQRMAIEADATFGEPRDAPAWQDWPRPGPSDCLPIAAPKATTSPSRTPTSTRPGIAPQPTSSTRAKNSAGATMPIPTTRFSTRSTPTTSAAAGAG